MGRYPDAIVAGDFTGDGQLDLAVADDGQIIHGSEPTRRRVVLLGNGDGTFQPAGHLRGGARPRSPSVAGDFTGDGNLDLAVANGGRLPRITATCPCCWATATAPSSPRSPYAVGVRAGRIVAGDFTGDGQLDLAVANDGANDVSVLLGNGDGTFQPQVDRTRSGSVSIRPRGGRLHRRRPARPGRRRRLTATTTCRCCWATATAPSRPPGAPTRWGRTQTPSWRATSTATAASTWPSPTAARDDVSVLLGNGDGTFQPQVTYAVGSVPDAIVAGDFNGDGRLDLAVANYGDRRRCRCCWATATAPSSPRSLTRWGRTPTPSWRATSPATASLDLAVANARRQRRCRCCWATATAPSSPRSPTRWGRTRTPSWRATSPATAASTSPSPTQCDDTVSVLLGNGDGTFQPQVTYAVGSDPDAIVAGDFTGDGQPRPGRRQRRFDNDGVGAAGQRRRHLPAPGHLRGGVVPSRHRGGRLHRRRPARPGRRQLRHPTTCRCCWATATAPSSPRSPTRWDRRTRRHRGGRLHRRRPPRPGRRQLRRATTVSVLLGNGDGTFADPGQLRHDPSRHARWWPTSTATAPTMSWSSTGPATSSIARASPASPAPSSRPSRSTPD